MLSEEMSPSSLCKSPLKVYGKYMNVNKIKVNACQHHRESEERVPTSTVFVCKKADKGSFTKAFIKKKGVNSHKLCGASDKMASKLLFHKWVGCCLI